MTVDIKIDIPQSWHWVSSYNNFQLDIVGFLAVLGEGCILANSQVAALSRLTYIPRLIPAPQALLRPSRPHKLQEFPADVIGVHSGNQRRHVNYIAHVLLDGESIPDFHCRCVEIRRRKNAGPIKAKRTGPLGFATAVGAFFTVVLIAMSLVLKDGPSLIATILLSVLSSITGFANKWELQLKKRNSTIIPPPGDVVIKYPRGAFLVVKCDEDISRELYFAPEEIRYNINRPEYYRLVSLVGTMLLMFGVIALANAKVTLQIAYAAAYIIINAVYWVVAALPQRLHWDLSSFEVTTLKYLDPLGNPVSEKNGNYTEALWKAIAWTKSIEWAKTEGIVPKTPAWNDWLHEAAEKAERSTDLEQELMSPRSAFHRMPTWDPRQALGEYMRAHEAGQKA